MKLISKLPASRYGTARSTLHELAVVVEEADNGICNLLFTDSHPGVNVIHTGLQCDGTLLNTTCIGMRKAAERPKECCLALPDNPPKSSNDSLHAAQKRAAKPVWSSVNAQLHHPFFMIDNAPSAPPPPKC